MILKKMIHILLIINLKTLYSKKAAEQRNIYMGISAGIPLVIPGSYIDAKIIKKIELYIKSGSNIVGI